MKIDTEIASLERPISIPQVAKLLEMSRRHALRFLLQMHAKDRESDRAGWLWSGGPRTKVRVNLSQLRIVHPELFGRKSDIRGELSAIAKAIEGLSVVVADVKKRVNGIGARVGALERRGQSGTVRSKSAV